MNDANRLVRLLELANQLKVPAQWLRHETEAGRIPHLRAGRQRLYNLGAVMRALANRARERKGGQRGQ